MSIGDDFFTAMQIPMLSGRGIEATDRPGAPDVAVVNEAFVKSYFGGEDPIGKSLTFSYECAKCVVQIVGVFTNTMYGSLKGRVGPIVYLPYAQGVLGPVSAMVYELRTRGNPLAYANTVREIVRSADSRIPLSEVQTQTAWIDQGINPEIIFARLCTVFAILALVISSVGLYATVSYNVARRTGEIGIRMALGARASSVVWTILREVVLLVALGLMISVPVAMGLSKYLESFLFGMKRNDPLAFAAAVMTLVTATVLAGYAPARKASRIDPTIALRHE